LELYILSPQALPWRVAGLLYLLLTSDGCINKISLQTDKIETKMAAFDNFIAELPANNDLKYHKPTDK
jgi:hypothetical protein